MVDIRGPWAEGAERRTFGIHRGVVTLAGAFVRGMQGAGGLPASSTGRHREGRACITASR